MTQPLQVTLSEGSKIRAGPGPKKPFLSLRAQATRMNDVGGRG